MTPSRLIVLVATVLADLLVDHHAYFGLDGTFGFGAWFGFVSCVVLIVVAKGLGWVLKRRILTMTASAFPPTLALIAGGLLLPLLRGHLRSAALLVVPLLALYLVWQVPDGIAVQRTFLGYELILVRGDALSRLFGTVFAIMVFAGGLFALNQNRVVELAAAFCYAGGAVGVTFAGDLLTVFIFWELMAIASTLVV